MSYPSDSPQSEDAMSKDQVSSNSPLDNEIPREPQAEDEDIAVEAQEIQETLAGDVTHGDDDPEVLASPDNQQSFQRETLEELSNEDPRRMTSSSPTEALNLPEESLQEEASAQRHSHDEQVPEPSNMVDNVPGTGVETSQSVPNEEDSGDQIFTTKAHAIPEEGEETSAKPVKPTSAESRNQDLLTQQQSPDTLQQPSAKSPSEDPLKPASAKSPEAGALQQTSAAKSPEAGALQQTSAAKSPDADALQQTSAAKSPSEAPPTSTSPTKTAHRVTIQDQTPAQPKRVSSGRLRMERELTRLKQAEERERLQEKERRRREVRKAVEGVRKEREKKGVTLTPGVEACRSHIRHIVLEEERMALEKEQKKLRAESKALQKEIENKYSLKDHKPNNQDMLAMAHNFYLGKVKDKDGIPAHVQRELTRQEIEDLRIVFDMFDVKGKGYIVPNDVRRAAGMLGFKAKKEVFSEMIEEVTGDKNGRVTFAHFLQFVVKGQGDGDDPYEAILQCFRLLDQDQKGYITARDLRQAADSQKVPLSNRAIREMIQEADVSGDSKVTSDEFIHIMLQSSMFRVTP